MKKQESKFNKILTCVCSILSITTVSLMLYSLYQSHLLSSGLFFIVIFITFIILTPLFIFRQHIFSSILQIVIIIITSILTFILFKYNDYFSKIGQNETYFEKYSLVALKNSDLVKNNTRPITPLGFLTSDPYFDTVKQYLINADQNSTGKNNADQKNSNNKPSNQPQSRPDLLKTSLEETSLKTYDNLLALTTALTSPKTTNDKLQTIFLGHTYLDALKDNNETTYNKLQILADVEIKVTPKHVETTAHASLDSPFTIYLSGIEIDTGIVIEFNTIEIF